MLLGKVIGSTVGIVIGSALLGYLKLSYGFILGGVLGLIAGLVIGHIVDICIKQLSPSAKVFFDSTFLVTGYIAQLDGTVSYPETAVSRNIMENDLKLTPVQISSAERLYNLGANSIIDMEQTMKKFMGCFKKLHAHKMLFLDIQVKMALADGHLHEKEQKVLHDICINLHIQSSDLNSLFDANNSEHTFNSINLKHQKTPEASPLKDSEITSAYHVLGIRPFSGMQAVEETYKKLNTEYNPDRLVANGLPKEMYDFAKTKQSKIIKAYQLIKVQQEKKGGKT